MLYEKITLLTPRAFVTENTVKLGTFSEHMDAKVISLRESACDINHHRKNSTLSYKLLINIKLK